LPARKYRPGTCYDGAKWRIERQKEELMADAPAFVSVKLPASLVNQARGEAQTMRRSVSAQIEYWATLGKALEGAGLTTSDSQALIARQDRAPYTVAPPGSLSVEADELHGHVLAMAKSGALAERTQQVVETNKTKRGKTPKAA